MALLDLFKTKKSETPIETKSSGSLTDSHSLMQFLYGVQAGTISPTYVNVANNIYKRNPTVRRCVDLQTSAIGGLDWKLLDEDGKEVKSHPVLDLLRNPNGTQGCATFFERLQLHKLLGGTGYIRAIRTGSRGEPKALQLLRPDQVSVMQGVYQDISSYQYNPVTGGTGQITIEVDPVTGRSDVLRWFFCNPTDDIAGLSPIVAALNDADLLNKGVDTNRTLLGNNGRPGAIIAFNQPLGEETRNKMQERMDTSFSGDNNGKPMVVDGTDLRYQDLSVHNRDMQYIEGTVISQKNIADALGIPEALLGNAGSTANVEAAYTQFYISSILPEAKRLGGQLSLWLTHMYPDLKDYSIVHEDNNIDALIGLHREKAKATAVKQSLSINEMRAELGYEPYVPEDDDEAENYNKPVLSGVSTNAASGGIPAPDDGTTATGDTVEEQDGNDQVEDNPDTDE